MNIKKISAAVCFVAVFAIFGIAGSADALTISRDLTIGSSGSDVKSLQQFLNNNGYPIASTGVGSKGYETMMFGGLTKAALQRYQSANGLTANGIVDAATRAKLAGTTSTSSYTIAQLQAMIVSLQAQIAALLGGNNTSGTTTTTGSPYITSIEVTDGGDENYIDKGDKIEITFSEAIDPESINGELEDGDTVTGITYGQTGGVSVTSAGKLTVKNIATFYVGDVESSSLFTSKIALSSTGKVLTITLTSGNDVEITDENFDTAAQLNGAVTDLNGNEMEADSEISDPDGTFGGPTGGGDDGDDEIDISSIVVSDGGEEDYIDIGDVIKITFDTPVKPSSINSDLDVGDTVTNIAYSEVGGVQVSSAGKITVKGIATFDMGSVEESGTFTSKMNLSANGKILTITITSGTDIEITDEDFSDATQLGGYVEDEDGNEMEANSDVDDPTGTFGGNNSSDDDDNDGDGPTIESIAVTDGGDEGYIDVNDIIKITFSEAIDPESINEDLSAGDYTTGVLYSEVGGVQVSSGGKVTIKGIATFYMGETEDSDSGTFTSKLALSSAGTVLTITLTSGSDIEIADEEFSETAQLGGYVEDEDGNAMEADSSIDDPTGSFGGGSDSDDGPAIDAIVIYDGQDNGYIDEDDYIKITFTKALKASSVNSSLDAGDYVSDIVSDETGGISVSAAGVVTIKNIASFDVGDVDEGGTFASKIALSTSGEVLTITLTTGSSIEITDEDYGTAKQLTGVIEDEDGNEMQADSSIDDPTGGF